MKTQKKTTKNRAITKKPKAAKKKSPKKVTTPFEMAREDLSEEMTQTLYDLLQNLDEMTVYPMFDFNTGITLSLKDHKSTFTRVVYLCLFHNPITIRLWSWDGGTTDQAVEKLRGYWDRD